MLKPSQCVALFYYNRRRRYIVLLFITEGFPRGHRTQTVFAYFRRRLRRTLLLVGSCICLAS